MIPYNTFEFFLLYFGVTFVIYTILPQKAKWCALLGGSLFYYVFAADGHVVCLLLSVLSIWLVGLGIQKYNDEFNAKKKQLLGL